MEKIANGIGVRTLDDGRRTACAWPFTMPFDFMMYVLPSGSLVSRRDVLDVGRRGPTATVHDALRPTQNVAAACNAALVHAEQRVADPGIGVRERGAEVLALACALQARERARDDRHAQERQHHDHAEATIMLPRSFRCAGISSRRCIRHLLAGDSGVPRPGSR